MANKRIIDLSTIASLALDDYFGASDSGSDVDGKVSTQQIKDKVLDSATMTTKFGTDVDLNMSGSNVTNIGLMSAIDDATTYVNFNTPNEVIIVVNNSPRLRISSSLSTNTDFSASGNLYGDNLITGTIINSNDSNTFIDVGTSGSIDFYIGNILKFGVDKTNFYAPEVSASGAVSASGFFAGASGIDKDFQFVDNDTNTHSIVIQSGIITA